MSAVSSARIVFSRPYRSAHELDYLGEVIASGHVHGDGPFTRRAGALLSGILGHDRVLLTASGTDALEMCSILLGVGAGDEVIMPSFTFASAATAVAILGATPVFVGNDLSDGNIDPAQVEAAITPRTRAISVMNYGGVGVDMPAIRSIADEHGLPVIEDNAHGLGATRAGRRLGTLGDLAIQSFHDTKNVHAGEGGALVVNRPELFERAEIIREKGTDRSKFIRGQVDKYTLVDVGSSFLMSELSAAVLTSQLEEFDAIQRARHAVWDTFRAQLADWADEQGVRLMTPPPDAAHPAHVFFMLMRDQRDQRALLAHLGEHDVVGTFHYVPLHESPAGRRWGREGADCSTAVDFSSRLVRLPLWPGLADADIARVVAAVTSFDGRTAR